jgi:hypothetical protein
MESNIDSVLSDFGIRYHFYGNTADKKKKIFRSLAIIQQGKEDDLCYLAQNERVGVYPIRSSYQANCHYLF